MPKISRDDPRAQRMSTDATVDLAGLIEFVIGKNRWVLATTLSKGGFPPDLFETDEV